MGIDALELVVISVIVISVAAIFILRGWLAEVEQRLDLTGRLLARETNVAQVPG